jgi:hypothetical protein
MLRGEVEVEQDEWQPVVLAWQTWTDKATPGIVLVAITEP